MSERIKDEFVNTTQGYAGAIVIEDGKQRGVAVRPGDTIWLSEQEQIVTANAPRREEDNPFINGTFKLLTRGAEVPNRRPIGAQQGQDDQAEAKAALEAQRQAEEEAKAKAERDRREALAKLEKEREETPPSPLATSQPVPPAVPAPQGQTAPLEEAATPEAPAKAPAPSPAPAAKTAAKSAKSAKSAPTSPQKSGGKAETPAPPPPQKGD